MSLRRWSSMRRSWRADWKLPNTLPALCMTFTSSHYALQSVMVRMRSVLLRGAAEPSNHPSRFLAERSGDFGGDTSPHNCDIILGQIGRSNDDVGVSVDGSEKRYRCRNYSSVRGGNPWLVQAS